MIYRCDDDTVVIDTMNNDITETEKEDLIFLREEEKLARDVYLYADNKYNIQIFSNISQSEQSHMDSVLALLIKYNMEDPVIAGEGVFSNSYLQELYNSLVSQVDISLIDALIVGATIEDLDINDITEFESNTEKIDMLNVYDNLKCGSRNHLRSFIDQLDLNSTVYEPQFISVEEFENIIASDSEKCGGN